MYENECADNLLAFAEGCKRQFALILLSPVAVYVCNRPRPKHLFGNALANHIGFLRTMKDRRWQKVIKNYARRLLHAGP
jgi:predicted LPLAT superfamily acyltransferase